MAIITPKQFQQSILRWFDQHGRKQLPWQRDKTPYRVWISEIMLQQTQVATVIPYYERFLRKFPTLLSLANAPEDDVLHLWAGLGYYSRARNLHRAARMVRDQYKGIFPNTLDGLQALPGIGESTAGAILSIAFNQPAAILDGNVKRVLTRFHAITDAVDEKCTQDQLWDIARYYTPLERTADYAQAMMDIGATLCTRSKPACERCPLTKHCGAHLQAITEFIPRKKAARILPVNTATFLILKNRRRILLLKRPSPGIWGGLWCFPEITGEPDRDRIEQHCLAQFGMTVSDYSPLPSFRHTFSHYHLDIFPIALAVKKTTGQALDNDKQLWYNPTKPKLIGLPKPINTIIRGLE